MNDIEPGYYEFRAVGIDHQGEMQVVNSYPKKAADKDELRKQRIAFIEDIKTSRKINDPKVTHTIRKDRDYTSYAEYWD